MAGGSADPSIHIWYSDVPGGVFSCHGSVFVPVPVAIVVSSLVDPRLRRVASAGIVPLARDCMSCDHDESHNRTMRIEE
jgi:hypothetical protein